MDGSDFAVEVVLTRLEIAGKTAIFTSGTIFRRTNRLSPDWKWQRLLSVRYLLRFRRG